MKWKLMVFGSGLLLLLLPFFIMLNMIIQMIGSVGATEEINSYSEGMFTGEYTEDLPIFEEIKGRGPITDEHARYAVGAAVKYKLLPSVILSQLGWESAYGQSYSGKNDHNYFGITWYSGCPYPKGSARGVGGSEGGNYMKFPNAKACYAYYGYMVATQSNFNACVGNKDPGQCLLILGRGGYAAAGITEGSAYYQGAMGIIKSYNLTEYDEFAIKKWGSISSTSSGGSTGSLGGGWYNPFPGSSLERSSFLGGQLFGKNPGGEFRMNGFHNGLDFGSVDHPGNEIHAVHAGTVVFAGNPSIAALGSCVIVIKDGDLSMVYQEFGSSPSNARVKVGDKVKAGQVIGIRDTAHLHLGFTKSDWYAAQASAFKNDGVWLDPLPYLQQSGK
ncbi:glucosaminidase domain-containing protein [Enterococcus hirae]|uniref:glucosaminidase domain-containing protein n=1 Tax=Enterococcus hirae TaxID=1354 RepID=UPI002072DD86|nr:glucosaminidase domain-containing protein [Enterococcus hirae]EMF0202636.1 glucosaminidase domain-containing protein [Enterococcus hirae]